MKKTLLFASLALAIGLSAPAAFANGFGGGSMFGGSVNSTSGSSGVATSGANVGGTGLSLSGSGSMTSNQSGAQAWVNPGHNSVEAGTSTYNNSGSVTGAGALNFGPAMGGGNATGASSGGAGASAFGTFGGGGYHHH